MEQLQGFLIWITILMTPPSLVIIDVVFFVKKKSFIGFEVVAFLVAAVYFVLGYALWDLPPYQNALNIHGMERAHEPFSSEHAISLLICILIGFCCYLILKFFRRSFPPLAEVLLLGGIFMSCIVNVLIVVQLICGARPEGMSLQATDYIFILCFCSVPVIFLAHVGELMVSLVKEKAEKQSLISYDNQILEKINMWFLQGANMFIAGLIVMIPILILLSMILCLFGQQPDSMILAFTKTSDWLLSKEISPPPVEYDEHYLCTVSLRGHEKLVKPIRCGVRKGRKIIVNRQLCVANAFEQLIMERTPGFHKALRNFYDTYGYPLSRHIKNAWSADLTYLIMKPLEWMFVVVLYLFDQDPETRICRQYLPIKEEH